MGTSVNGYTTSPNAGGPSIASHSRARRMLPARGVIRNLSYIVAVAVAVADNDEDEDETLVRVR
ncbi:hypothetical protein ACG7TL_004457 [Trametes sanguinea]